jgi:DNA-directed RNA polymerase subunit H
MGGEKLAKKFSILEHELVPEHVIASEKEVEEILKKYQCEKGQLPLIRTSDPAVKEIGAKSGDVIKIIRKSPTAGKAIAYRYVVEA